MHFGGGAESRNLGASQRHRSHESRIQLFFVVFFFFCG